MNPHEPHCPDPAHHLRDLRASTAYEALPKPEVVEVGQVWRHVGYRNSQRPYAVARIDLHPLFIGMDRAAQINAQGGAMYEMVPTAFFRKGKKIEASQLLCSRFWEFLGHVSCVKAVTKMETTICWYGYWGWSIPVREIYEKYADLVDDDDEMTLGPASVIWGRQNLTNECIQSVLDGWPKDGMTAVRESLVELLKLPEEVRIPMPANYDGQHPELFPPTVPMIRPDEKLSDKKKLGGT